jgi:predicted phosphate transport protein (TIGR00153 family)
MCFGWDTMPVLMAFSLIPREEKFFADFVGLSEEIQAGSKVLQQMLSSKPLDITRAATIKDIEHKCDTRTREIIDRLNRTFVTPLDREDIHTLILYLDNVMDMIDAAGGCVRLYKIRSCRYGARELADIIVRCTDQILYATQKLESRQGLEEHVVEINRLENEADHIHGEAVGRLFTEEPNAIEVLKWKEILDLLERATDECEDVANEVEGVLVKYA